MKIRSILTIKYAGITALFLVFMATIYCVNEHLRSDSFIVACEAKLSLKPICFLTIRLM